MKRSATAVWTGGLKNGKSTMSGESGVLSEAPYSFRTRFEGEKGTNPEELIGAAHAGCFSMALSLELEKAGMTAESTATKADVTLEQKDGGFAITAVHLPLRAKVPVTLRAKVPGASQAALESAANSAEKSETGFAFLGPNGPKSNHIAARHDSLYLFSIGAVGWLAFERLTLFIRFLYLPSSLRIFVTHPVLHVITAELHNAEHRRRFLY